MSRTYAKVVKKRTAERSGEAASEAIKNTRGEVEEGGKPSSANSIAKND